MPPRFLICAQCLRCLRQAPSRMPRFMATAAAITPAPSPNDILSSPPPIARYPPTQPPSHKPPEFRKTQLHRHYTSLLRSSPLLLLFQHSNLKATEWMAVRRELNNALAKADTQSGFYLAPDIKIQTIQAGIFESALAVTEHFDPVAHPGASTLYATDPATQSSAERIPDLTSDSDQEGFSHFLSKTARQASFKTKGSNPLKPLFSGPIAALTFPTVSPPHLKAALSILAPEKPNFAAPTRRANPGYHDPATQAGLQKLLMLGARIEGRVFDGAGPRWVGAMDGGLEGLQAQVVALLGGIAAGVTNVLDASTRSLWFTLEGRKCMLEEEGKGPLDEAKRTE